MKLKQTSKVGIKGSRASSRPRGSHRRTECRHRVRIEPNRVTWTWKRKQRRWLPIGLASNVNQSVPSKGSKRSPQNVVISVDEMPRQLTIHRQGAIQLSLLSIISLSAIVALASFRSSLKAFEKTCVDTSKAMEATEKASKEVEELSMQLQREVPETLFAVENASMQIEDLVVNLQSITGSVSKNIKQPVEAVYAAADTTKDVIKRAPNDIQYVSDLVNVVLGQWRGRISDTIGNIDSLRNTRRAQREANKWISAWREKDGLNASNVVDPESMPITIPITSEEVAKSIDRKQKAQNKVELALSAAEDAAANAEEASGRLQKAMLEYESLSSYESFDEGL